MPSGAPSGVELGGHDAPVVRVFEPDPQTERQLSRPLIDPRPLGIDDVGGGGVEVDVDHSARGGDCGWRDTVDDGKGADSVPAVVVIAGEGPQEALTPQSRRGGVVAQPGRVASGECLAERVEVGAHEGFGARRGPREPGGQLIGPGVGGGLCRGA